jgi:hypothetical protein
MSSPDRQADLIRWIASSRRLQRRFGVVLCVAAIASIIALQFDAVIGKAALAIIAIVAVCTYWVTGSHILDWRNQLETIDQARRRDAKRQ